MRLLVLGGTRFVGRALVEDALARGWEVAALNRGTRPLPAGAELLRADRTDADALRAALTGRAFDGVVDTWAGAPRAAALAASVVEAERRAYVSSCSVYVWGQHVDESSPVVAGSPDADESDYAADKRGGELAWDGALWLRAGLILGPHEDIGRLPWWLSRISRGGRVVAPGRPERPLQYVDARDLASFGLDLLAAGRTGPVDVTSASGHATTRSLLEACTASTDSDAALEWVPWERLSAAGVEPWTQLPCWVPEDGEFAGFLEADASYAASLGLVCRPVEETVADTWAWVQRDGMPEQRPDRAVHGLPSDVEAALLSTP